MRSFSNDFVLTRMKQWMITWDPSQRWIILRLFVSTVVGEFFDTAIFIGLATFVFHIFPIFIYFTLVATMWVVKSSIEIVFFPITIFAIKWLKRYLGVDVAGTTSYSPFAFNREGGINLYGKSPEEVQMVGAAVLRSP